jgi:hypothetical protein
MVLMLLGRCKENRPMAYLVSILVFDDEQDQMGLMHLHVFILYSLIGCIADLDRDGQMEKMIFTLMKTLEA